MQQALWTAASSFWQTSFRQRSVEGPLLLELVRSSCGADAWRQQYLQAGLTDHSLALSHGEAADDAFSASGSSIGAEGASNKADGDRTNWLSQMALESEASSNAPGPWRADQPSCWQHLTGTQFSTSALRLPALVRHTQGTCRADQPLGSKWHSTAEEPVGLWQPSEGAGNSRPSAAFQQRV